MARSVGGEAEWDRQIALRRYALEALRDGLRREGRSQIWLRRELRARSRIEVSVSLLSKYLRGYSRIPAHVLTEVCWIAGVRERDVLARIADEAVLLQATKPAKPRNRARKTKPASVN